MTVRKKNNQTSSWIPKYISMICALLLLMLIVVQGSVWLTKAAIFGSPRLSKGQIQTILEISEFPRKLSGTFEGLFDLFTPFSDRILIPRKSTISPEKFPTFPSADDPGFLLLSGLDSTLKSVVIKMIRISDGSVEALWTPDWKDIVDRSTPRMRDAGFGSKSAEALNPLLLDDGSVIFSTIKDKLEL